MANERKYEFADLAKAFQRNIVALRGRSNRQQKILDEHNEMLASHRKMLEDYHGLLEELSKRPSMDPAAFEEAIGSLTTTLNQQADEMEKEES